MVADDDDDDDDDQIMRRIGILLDINGYKRIPTP